MRSIAKASGPKISLSILAVALMYASGMPAGFAGEETSTTTTEHAQGSKPSAEPGRASPPAGAAVAQDKAKLDGIDPRITAPLRRPGSTVGDVKPSFRIGYRGYIKGHKPPAPGARGLIVRNAIGQPVQRHDEIEERSGVARGVPMQNPVSAAPGIAAPGAGNLAKIDDELERPTTARPSANPTVSAPVASRGSITGTGLHRAGVVPSRVGGPAKMIAGINGTDIRPRP
jgi:hypothetical protein